MALPQALRKCFFLFNKIELKNKLKRYDRLAEAKQENNSM